MIALEEWPVERRLPTRTVRPPPSTLARVTTPIDGWCAPGFAPVREAFAGELRRAGRGRGRGPRDRRRRGGRRPRGRVDRRRPHPAVAARHDRRLLLGRARRSSRCWCCSSSTTAGWRSTSPSPTCGPSSRTAARPGPPSPTRSATAPGVPAIRELLTDEDLFDWDRMTARPRRHRGVVGARRAAGLPHQHLRPPRRASSSAGRAARCPANALRGGGRTARRRRVVRRAGRRAAPLRRRRVGRRPRRSPRSTRSTGSRATCS